MQALVASGVSLPDTRSRSALERHVILRENVKLEVMLTITVCRTDKHRVVKSGRCAVHAIEYEGWRQEAICHIRRSPVLYCGI